ncbi:nucleotidyl transferase AbiEii/AbiGii toxin family protein [Caballeronia sp. LP006]|uniref:nucleotidyl transferase AbiEii/AbiGii toxin family protein n=1 Tax=Caballeronia sp. LP006 TaxID=3038552 RepID=UPI00285B5A9B|nr:nucleotidyl transferase AbiEii/AbiGii toxin family protein [Caballeronia sp. LP006]MDR5832503.1 nucleotidyl transferase AbiEii/AbiGii toxin family protein [Caballeronia sp. LP006]
MAGTKPKSADGYSADVTAACESTLLTLLGAFGTLKDTLRLVGGLVPRYLTPEQPPDVPAHAGTADVDVVLNLQVLADGDGYASLADQLEARGFTRHMKNGVVSSWQWQQQIDENTIVLVEFLRDADGDKPGRAVSVDGERVSAVNMPYAGIVHDWFVERTITGTLLSDGGKASETIRCADVPAFIVLKALALDQRNEPKDAADLIHVLQYSGKIDDVADLVVERALSGQHEGAVEAGLAALRRRFCDDEHSEGWEKVGAVGYARFHATGDEDELARDQRDAAARVQALVESVEAKVAARRAG